MDQSKYIQQRRVLCLFIQGCTFALCSVLAHLVKSILGLKFTPDDAYRRMLTAECTHEYLQPLLCFQAAMLSFVAGKAVLTLESRGWRWPLLTLVVKAHPYRRSIGIRPELSGQIAIELCLAIRPLNSSPVWIPLSVYRHRCCQQANLLSTARRLLPW